MLTFHAAVARRTVKDIRDGFQMENGLEEETLKG
jgi:hypothetical protein